MRTLKSITILLMLFIFPVAQIFAQEEESKEELKDTRIELQNFRYNNQTGLNVFEAPKDDTPFNGFGVRLGGDFAIQFQGISQSSDLARTDTTGVVELGSNFNLPTANLNLDVQVYDGVRMHLRTYLSSAHHAEAWVKGGYIRIDKLDFIQEDFLSSVMDYTFIKVGMDEINYGDAHFRRSDNARAIYNPFVGNYLMDAFTTEPFAEVTVLHPSGFLGMVGISNGRLNQTVVENRDQGATFYGKLGWDKDVNDDLRVRLTGSYYTSSSDTGSYNSRKREYLYSGDRAGSRYYGIEHDRTGFDSDFSGRYAPRAWGALNAIQINPFVKFKGLEFFGIYEIASNNFSDVGGDATQIGAELLYRFGGKEQFYGGGRFNSVSAKDTKDADVKDLQRINVGAGWYMTRNMLAKVEYVTSSYSGDGYKGTALEGFEYNGVVVEAVIGF